MRQIQEIVVDLVVIGSGPAGQKGAVQATKLGRTVAIIERSPCVGGVSVNNGTIPSKTLREAVLDLTGFRQRSFYGRDWVARKDISINDLNFRLEHVRKMEHELIAHQLRENGVQIIKGHGRFDDSHRITVTDIDGSTTHVITAKHALIATGSAPRNPFGVPFDKTTILDSTSLLEIDSLPDSMLVLGSGIIGCEYASIFAGLGVPVTVIDKRSRPLSLLDAEIGDFFRMQMEVLGTSFIMDRNIESIERTPNGAAVVLDGGWRVEAEVLLYALGRQACTKNLGLENTGLSIDDRGYIPVDEYFRTSVPNICAVGDVVGNPALAATSMEQGRLAVRHMFAGDETTFPQVFPYGIYAIPEISGLGPTEDELRKQGIPYETGRAYYHEIARGHINGDTTGMIKLVFHRNTFELLSVHIIGSQAAELIHIGQLAIHQKMRVDYFVEQILNYPTFAEGYRIAAINGLNKIEQWSLDRYGRHHQKQPLAELTAQ
jgi:NAD(P) transhydrogenase